MTLEYNKTLLNYIACDKYGRNGKKILKEK